MTDSAKEIQELHVSNQALTARVAQLEAKLRDAEAAVDTLRHMEAAVNSSLNGVALADLNGLLYYANPAFLHLWGLESQAEIIGKPAVSFWTSAKEAEQVLQQVIQQGAWSGELSGKRKDGKVFTAQVSATLFFNNRGEPAGMMAAFVDRTERKQSEIALIAAAARYRELVENMSSGVVVYEAVEDGNDFIIRELNTAGEAIDQESRQEVVGRKATEVFPGIKSFGLFDVMQRVWRTGIPEHHPTAFYKDEKRMGWRENYVYRLPSREVVAVYDDVSARRQVEDNLRFFALAVENASDAIGMSTPEGKHYYQNKAFDALFGDVGANPSETLYADPAVGREVFESIEQGIPWNGEVKMCGRQGDILDIYLRAYAIFGPTQKILGLVGLHTDITARRQAEAALRETQDLLETAVAQSPSGILIGDAPDVTIRLANPAALAMRGGDTRNLTGIDVSEHTLKWQVYRPDGTPYPPELLPLSRAILNGEQTQDEEIIIRDENGVDHWVNANAAPVRDEAGNITAGIVIFHDFTERKHAEEERERLQSQLLQAQKMESVGRLAGGIAHDFNNILMVIIGSVDLALEKIEPSHPIHTDIIEIRAAALRSADITRQLLAFARRQTRAPMVLDLNECIQGMFKMLRRLIGENIEFELRLQPDLWPLYMDPAQIHQVLANLCVNARDAITGVGKIIVETGMATFTEADSDEHPEIMPGMFDMLMVSDTGCGMDAETRASIFEPFFTTKAADKGTGLGMATVYGIVKQNNGFISVYSEPGKGATIKIYLPRYETAVEEGSALPGTTTEPLSLGKGETILFVEDDPSILRIGCKLLERLGYHVLAAVRPREALRLAKEHGGEIHLLLTDMVMPEMNGRELADLILSQYPGIKLLFMSGYTSAGIVHHGVLKEGTHFIQKPFSVDELSRKVRCVLLEE